MGLSRRQFIRIGAGAGAVAMASGLTTRWWGLQPPKAHDPATDGDQVVASYCELCFWGCGILAHVKDGQVTKIVGNPDHPLSRGRLCARGLGGTGQLYDPDRLRTPLLRQHRGGQDVFVEASWDGALNHIAEKLEAVRRRHGPEAVALFTHGSGGSWFKHFMQAWGSPNVGAPSYAQCRGAREAGYQLTFGTGLGSPEPVDLAHAKVITLLGSHLGENMHNTQVQDLAVALESGAELVVVDPRYSTAASKARYWLPIKPGTDLALLLAWMNVIITEQRYDAAYLERHATGFEELEAHVADKTPEWAYPRTGIHPALIRDSARLIASARPASLIHPGRRSVWYGDDTQRERAKAILAALLGSWGRRGGYIQHARLPLQPYPLEHELPDIQRRPADRPKEGGHPMATEVIASGLRDATIPGTAEYDLKAWLVYGCNLMQALPDQKRTREAMEHLELLVTVDVLPSEIAGYSDVVLPEATYLERDDDVWSGAWRRPFIAGRRAAVAPRYESRPGWWIAKALGERTGLSEFFPWADARQYVDERLRRSGYDPAELDAGGVILGARVPTCEEEGLPVTVFTDSGKIELRSEELARAGFDPLPEFYPPEEGPPGFFRLLSGRAPTHTFGRTTNNLLLAEPFAENEVWINATVARALDGFFQPLKSGDRVYLVNQDGVRSGPVRAKVTERIRGDCVYLVHGWGQQAPLQHHAHRRGASTAELTTRVKVDPIMGGTALNTNFVRLEPDARSGA
jgi:thiosulfate reductase / polysulfide reductase chain A